MDSRWVLKVTDYRLNEMYTLQNSPRQVDINGLYKKPMCYIIRTALI